MADHENVLFLQLEGFNTVYTTIYKCAISKRDEVVETVASEYNFCDMHTDISESFAHPTNVPTFLS